MSGTKLPPPHLLLRSLLSSRAPCMLLSLDSFSVFMYVCYTCMCAYVHVCYACYVFRSFAFCSFSLFVLRQGFYIALAVLHLTL